MFGIHYAFRRNVRCSNTPNPLLIFPVWLYQQLKKKEQKIHFFLFQFVSQNEGECLQQLL